jgi:hypothetical protein
MGAEGLRERLEGLPADGRSALIGISDRLEERLQTPVEGRARAPSGTGEAGQGLPGVGITGFEQRQQCQAHPVPGHSEVPVRRVDEGLDRVAAAGL